MSRKQGITQVSQNFEPHIAEPLDARGRVETLQMLTQSSTWTRPDGNAYTYKGMPVIVHADPTPENNGLYILMASDYTQSASWLKTSLKDFLSLVDVLATTYLGKAYSVPMVNAEETGLDLASSVIAVLTLNNDFPNSYAGQALKLCSVKADMSGIEFIDPATLGFLKGITKAQIEAQLQGTITSHSHPITNDIHTKTVDILINTEPTVLSGNTFTPAITQKPVDCKAIQWVNDDGRDLSLLIDKFVKNGDYYDVVLTPVEEDYLGVDITVFASISVNAGRGIVTASLTQNLTVNPNPPNISGSSFVPAITSAPLSLKAIRWDGDNGYDVSDLIAGAVKNGNYYDIKITPLEDEFLGVTLTVFMASV